jgi:hypothetical protein
MNPCIVARTPTNENIESFLRQPWAAGSRKRSKMQIKRGHLYVVDFNPRVRTKPGKLRPARAFYDFAFAKETGRLTVTATYCWDN